MLNSKITEMNNELENKKMNEKFLEGELSKSK